MIKIEIDCNRIARSILFLAIDRPSHMSHLIMQDYSSLGTITYEHAREYRNCNGFIRWVLEHPDQVDISNDEQRWFEWSLSCGSDPLAISFFKNLLKNPNVDPSANESLAIQKTSRDENKEMLKLLIEDGRADPNASNNYAIKHAMQFDRSEEIIDLLLPHVNERNKEDVLSWAIAHADDKILEKILRVKIVVIDPSILLESFKYGIDRFRMILRVSKSDPSEWHDHLFR